MNTSNSQYPNVFGKKGTELIALGIALAMLPMHRAALAAPDEYATAVLADDPVVYYRLNETAGNAGNAGNYGVAFDAVYHGTPSRNVPTAAGDSGVCFDEAADYLASLSITPASLTGNPDFSAETVLFVPTGAIAQVWAPYLFWRTPGTGNSAGFGFRENDPFRSYIGFYNAAPMMDTRYCADTWVHIVWTRDSDNGTNDSDTGNTLYINGEVMNLVTDPLLNPGFDATLTLNPTVLLISRGPDSFALQPLRWMR